jgi:hypothetical protein
MIRQALVTGLLLFVSAAAANADDKIVGAAWEITFPARGNEKDKTIKFRATTDGKVYDAQSEVIGSWKGEKDKVQMEITGFKRDQFNGKYELTNISNDEKKPRWNGKWTPDGGEKSKTVVVKLLKD